MSMENETINTEEDFELQGESEFDFPDTIEPIAIELVPEEDETNVDDALETSMSEEVEEKVRAMQQAFIFADELEETYIKGNQLPTNKKLQELYEIAGLDCPEVIFNTSPLESEENKVALVEMLEEVSTKYAEIFANVVGKITHTVQVLTEGSSQLPKDDLEKVESIRYRANVLQTNYIKRDNGVMNAFTTPMSEFRDLLNAEYAVSPNFEVVYKLCDKVLDSKDKTFADISCYLEVLYKDWLTSLEKLNSIKLMIEEDFDGSFRGKLDILNLRDKLESITINTGKISEIYQSYSEGNIFDFIQTVMFEEL